MLISYVKIWLRVTHYFMQSWLWFVKAPKISFPGNVRSSLKQRELDAKRKRNVDITNKFFETL